MTPDEQAAAERMGCPFVRFLPDGRIISIIPKLFNKFTLVIGLDEQTYETGW